MTMQKDMMGRAVRDSFAMLDPRVQIQNPVMFLVWLSAVMTSVLAVASIFGVQDAGVPTYYVVAIAVILWLTDLFSNFAEALAEGRGKAQAGKKLRAPISRTMNTSRNTNMPLVVDRVPALSATLPFLASEPAIAV